jgi:hypothetical protein
MYPGDLHSKKPLKSWRLEGREWTSALQPQILWTAFVLECSHVRIIVQAEPAEMNTDWKCFVSFAAKNAAFRFRY